MALLRLALALLLVSEPAAAAQETVRGVVRDPQDRVVPRSDVELSCGGPALRTLTRDDGSFALLAGPAHSTCELTVWRAGFVRWRRTIRLPADAFAVTLVVAALRETVTVAPPAANGDRWVLSSVGSAADADKFELKVLGPDSGRWLDLMMNSAGAFVGQRRVFVDGMPADAPPDAARISHVAVNGDPFSAEFTGVDQNRIDITTSAPDRRWRFSAGAPTWIEGGGDALVQRAAPDARRRYGSVSGPIPHLPLTFFAQGSRFSSTEQPTYLATDRGAVTLDAVAATQSSISAWSIGAAFDRAGVAWQTAIDGSDMRLENAGVGGLNAPAAALRSTMASHRLLSSWKTSDRALVHRGGLLIVHNVTESSAVAGGQARTIFGQLNTSGRELISDAGDAAKVIVRHAIDGMAAGRPWTIGVEVSREVMHAAPRPNPLGRLYLDALEGSRGTLIVQRGAPTLTAGTTTSAIFVQATPVLRENILIRAGARGDWQASDGLLLSPRATMVTRGRGFVVVSRAGLFVEPWPAGFFMEIVRRDGAALPTRVIANVAAGDFGPAADAGYPLTLRVAPGLARRRDAVLETVLARKMGKLAASLGHKWTRGMAVAGATRSLTADGLTDSVDSDRRVARHQLHARVGLSLGKVSLTAHYEFAHSRDDASDPFALPARQDDVAGEWAPSAGVAAHNASIVASMSLPGAIRAFVSGSASSGSPYSIVSGRDAAGLGAFTDRGGAPRNGALGPPQRSVSVYASRTVAIPRARGLAFDVGVRVENLFNRINVTTSGMVAGTAWLGQPLTALAGRTFNVWASIAR